MSLEKTIYMNQLFAIYQPLLTDKQQEMLQLFYEEDYSLSEIAEHYQISRQGVRDNIKRGEQALENYESSLMVFTQSQIRIKTYQKMMECIDINEIKAMIQELITLEYDV